METVEALDAPGVCHFYSCGTSVENKGNFPLKREFAAAVRFGLQRRFHFQTALGCVCVCFVCVTDVHCSMCVMYNEHAFKWAHS